MLWLLQLESLKVSELNQPKWKLAHFFAATNVDAAINEGLQLGAHLTLVTKEMHDLPAASAFAAVWTKSKRFFAPGVIVEIKPEFNLM